MRGATIARTWQTSIRACGPCPLMFLRSLQTPPPFSWVAFSDVRPTTATTSFALATSIERSNKLRTHENGNETRVTRTSSSTPPPANPRGRKTQRHKHRLNLDRINRDTRMHPCWVVSSRMTKEGESVLRRDLSRRFPLRRRQQQINIHKRCRPPSTVVSEYRSCFFRAPLHLSVSLSHWMTRTSDSKAGVSSCPPQLPSARTEKQR